MHREMKEVEGSKTIHRLNAETSREKGTCEEGMKEQNYEKRGKGRAERRRRSQRRRAGEVWELEE